MTSTEPSPFVSRSAPEDDGDRPTPEMVTASVVSHGHGPMVEKLVAALLRETELARLIVTINRPELLELPTDPRLTVIRNARPMGFGANHNQAFQACETPYFAVINPDIELSGDTFAPLLACMIVNRAHIVAPMVVGSDGTQQDS